VSEWTNKNLLSNSTLLQLLAPYTDPVSHNAQRYRQTDGQKDRQSINQSINQSFIWTRQHGP